MVLDRARVAVAQMTDIAELAPRLRPADVAEVLASGGHTAEQALLSSWLASRWCYTVYDQTGPLAMFGVSPWEENAGCPWMLGSQRLMDVHKRTFILGSRQVVARMQAEFTSLENYVDARNIASIRWLRWLGFTIHPAQPWGVSRLPFHRFTWTKETSHV